MGDELRRKEPVARGTAPGQVQPGVRAQARRMLEWRIALDHDWAFRPGVLGRGLKAQLAPGHWSELEQTYSGADIQENWMALSRTLALFRTVATDVARQLALEYPHRLDAQMTLYLERIRTRNGSDGVG